MSFKMKCHPLLTMLLMSK